jgi:hypothetical protein
VLFLESLKEALDEPCQILVVSDHPPVAEGNAGASGACAPGPALPPGDAGQKYPFVPAEFARQHMALPYRTIVVTDRQGVWLNALADARLHPKRFRIVATQTDDAGASLGKIEPHLKADSWPEAVIQAYEWWITLFKGEEAKAAGAGKWNLVIGFQREGGQLSGWQGKLTSLVFGVVDVAVCWVKPVDARSPQGGTCTPPEKCAGLVTATAGLRTGDSLNPGPITASPKACVYFDNHGNTLGNKCLGLETMANKQDELAVYHGFGAGNLSLFHLLERPPADPFALRYLVLGLLEAALTNVFILDERVAEATVRDPDGRPDFPNGLLTDLNRSRVFPLYTVRCRPDRGKAPYCLSPAVRNESSHGENFQNEGAYFADADGAGIRATLSARKADIDQNVTDASSVEADVLVVHEGVVDRLDKDGIWRTGFAGALYGAVPAVVRTSGRGSEPRGLPGSMSFLEFSEVSWATYQSMNKYLLAKPLLGSVGGKAEDSETR